MIGPPRLHRARLADGKSNSISVSITAWGSSSWNHIPAVWGVPDVHGRVVKAIVAASALWWP